MTTRLVLVRHGEARAGVDHIIGGREHCKGLTDRGREQSAALRDRLARTRELIPDTILTSPLRRAVETAAIVYGNAPGLPSIEVVDGLRELDPGDSDGLHIDEYTARYGRIDDPDPERLMAPGGESPKTFDARVRDAIAEVVDVDVGQTIVVFSHGGFVTAATLALLGGPGVDATGGYWIPPRNTSLNILETEPEQPGWALERYNDAAHLDG